jgi:hypothetical protein
MAETAADQTLLRRRMLTMGALIGGAVTFLAVGIIDDLVKIALGAAVGALAGLVFWAQVVRAKKERRAEDLKSLNRNDLQKMAANLAIEGRASMTKEQLSEAIAVRTSVPDDTGGHVIDLVEGAETKLGHAVDKVKHAMHKNDADTTDEQPKPRPKAVAAAASNGNGNSSNGSRTRRTRTH